MEPEVTKPTKPKKKFKLQIKNYQRAIELVGVMIGLYLIRGIWTLSGFWNTNEYFRFEALRLLVTMILLIKVLGFIRRKLSNLPNISQWLMNIRILEGILGGFAILSINGLYDYKIPIIIITLVLVGTYLTLLIISLNKKYINDRRVKYLRYFLLSVLLRDMLMMSLGFVFVFRITNFLNAMQYFLDCIPLLGLVWCLKKLNQLELEPDPLESQEWKPE